MPSILITGASRGIGRALVDRFNEAGWDVHAACRQPEDVADRAKAVGVNWHPLDLNDPDSIARLAKELAGTPLDVLLNNAGIYGPRTGFGETDHDQWGAVMGTNVAAPLRMAEAFHRHLLKGARKVIASISSSMGSIGKTTDGGSYPYRASKAALNMVTKVMSVDLGAEGFCVISIDPGWVRTDMGGQEARLDTATSSKGLCDVIGRLTAKDNGAFYRYDGSKLPW